MFRFFEKMTNRPDTIEEAMHLAAKEFVRVVSESSASSFAEKFNHSEASLHYIDEWLNRFFTSGQWIDSNTQFLCAAYIFEIAREKFGGRYMGGGKENPYLLVMGEPECQIGFCAIEKVKMRTLNGPEDNIPFFFEGIEPSLTRKANATIV